MESLSVEWLADRSVVRSAVLSVELLAVVTVEKMVL